MTNESEEKKGPGQPTLYRPKYCQKIIDIMKEGASAVEFAAEIGVCKDTVYEWANTIPEFSYAFTRARTLCQAWWEKQGRTNLSDTTVYMGDSTKFNDRLWNKNMACRFRDDWVEKKAVEVTTPLDGDKNLLEALLRVAEEKK